MKLSLFMFSLVFSGSVYSGTLQDEINHLLAYVEKTTCAFERNGKHHSGKQAVKHIKKKLNYYKDEINNTEKFIELSATKSMMSGQYYMIGCKGKNKIRSQIWLLDELMKHRKLKNVSVPTKIKN